MEDIIYRRVLTAIQTSQDLTNLVQISACECRLHLERLRSMVDHPHIAHTIMSYVQHISLSQKKLLIARVTLSLLSRLSAIVLPNNHEEIERKKKPCVSAAPPKREAGNGGFFEWSKKDVDSAGAFTLLILWEAQQSGKSGVADVKVSADVSVFCRGFISENIGRICVSVPGLVAASDSNFVQALLSTYVNKLCRYHRLLQTLIRLDRSNSPSEKKKCASASVATLRHLKLATESVDRWKGKGWECCICRDTGGGGGATVLPCKHGFHWLCISAWLAHSNTCPLCRYELPTDDVCYEVSRHLKMLRQFPQDQ